MTTGFRQHLAKRLSEVLRKKVTITVVKRVHGGDINEAYAVQTSEGNFFIKTNHTSLAGIFQKEYYGLTRLRETSILKVPKPIHWDRFEDTLCLILEYIERAAPTSQTGKILGEGIAALHRQTQPQFGLNYDNFIGSLLQSNQQADTWAEFYAAQRILPLIQKAFDNHQCTLHDVKDAERLCNKLNELFPNEPPALLHGDLWNGNVMTCTNNEVAIYDPAVYFGHREMDIAMTLLFGGFDASFYHYYNETYLLQSDWQQRVSLCQLYPLLVHLNLFGSGYYGRVKSVLGKYQ